MYFRKRDFPGTGRALRRPSSSTRASTNKPALTTRAVRRGDAGDCLLPLIIDIKPGALSGQPIAGARANRTLGTVALRPEDAVKSLLSSEDPWLRSCGAYAIGALRLAGFTKDLARLAEDADPLLREAARQAQSGSPGVIAPRQRSRLHLGVQMMRRRWAQPEKLPVRPALPTAACR